MKKILSFLLVCTLILSMSAIMANAAGEAYTFTFADGYFTICSGADAMGGRIALRLETEKVKPMAVIVTGSGKSQQTSYEVATSETSEKIWGEFTYPYAATYYATDDKYTYIALDWYNQASVASGSEIGYLNIEIADESALDSASIVADFDISAVDGFLPTTSPYGCVIGVGVTETQPVSLTYPNSDKSAGGSTDTPIAEDFKDDENLSTDGYYAGSEEITSGTVSYGDYSAEMGTNGKVHTFFAKAAADLEALSYGVKATINNVEYKFPGKAKVEAGKAWAIKIVIPDGTFKDDVAADLTSMEKYIVE